MNFPKHLSSVLLAATLGIGMAALTTPSYGQAQKPADTESTAPRPGGAGGPQKADDSGERKAGETPAPSMQPSGPRATTGTGMSEPKASPPAAAPKKSEEK